jgi:hypothetical protein
VAPSIGCLPLSLADLLIRARARPCRAGASSAEPSEGRASGAVRRRLDSQYGWNRQHITGRRSARAFDLWTVSLPWRTAKRPDLEARMEPGRLGHASCGLAARSGMASVLRRLPAGRRGVARPGGG